MIAWTIFYNPVSFSSGVLLWLLLPLCVAVAFVYKTVRTKNLSRLWLEILALVGYLAVGMVALGVALWIVQGCWL